MSEKELNKKVEELIKKMTEERGGNLPAEWDYVARKDVNFMEAYNNLYASGLMDGKVLPIKTRELIAIALLAYRQLDEAVYSHCKRAIKFGATKAEILEAIETAIVPGGAPTFGCGLRALMKIEREENTE